MKYSIKYFISKFEAIPEDEWCMARFEDDMGRHCALGHLGVTGHYREPKLNEEARRLSCLLSPSGWIYQPWQFVTSVNDDISYRAAPLGSTPKQRILNALYSKLREGMAIKSA